MIELSVQKLSECIELLIPNERNRQTGRTLQKVGKLFELRPILLIAKPASSHNIIDVARTGLRLVQPLALFEN